MKTARKELATVKENLKKAKEHADKQNLAMLKQNADKAEAKALEYEALLNETVTKTEALAKDKATLAAAAEKYMKVCSEFLDGQQKMQKEEFVKALAANQAAGGRRKN